MKVPESIASLLTRARVAGVRARLTDGGAVDLHGPPAARDLGRQLRAREPELREVLAGEKRHLDGLRRVLTRLVKRRGRRSQLRRRP